jgi:hypothetical protein
VKNEIISCLLRCYVIAFLSWVKKIEKGERSVDFLGFTHYMGKRRKGKTILKLKTSKRNLPMPLFNGGSVSPKYPHCLNLKYIINIF